MVALGTGLGAPAALLNGFEWAPSLPQYHACCLSPSACVVIAHTPTTCACFAACCRSCVLHCAPPPPPPYCSYVCLWCQAWMLVVDQALLRVWDLPPQTLQLPSLSAICRPLGTPLHLHLAPLPACTMSWLFDPTMSRTSFKSP